MVSNLGIELKLHESWYPLKYRFEQLTPEAIHVHSPQPQSGAA